MKKSSQNAGTHSGAGGSQVAAYTVTATATQFKASLTFTTTW